VPIAIAFLRAINVGGRFIKMADLAAHFESLGLADVSTYINSGNVLFTTRARDLSQLGARIERDLEPLLGFKSEVFLRTPAEVHAIAAAAMAHRSAVPQSGEVNVAFLAAPLESEQQNKLEGLRSELDEFVHTGREVYWLCKGSQMSSKVSNAVMERKLRLRCTFRRASMLSKLSEQLRTHG
jgi:uncharacterized protein (DUF1697 family)